MILIYSFGIYMNLTKAQILSGKSGLNLIVA